MMENSKLKFSKYIKNICRSKSFGNFVLIVADYDIWAGLGHLPSSCLIEEVKINSQVNSSRFHKLLVF